MSPANTAPSRRRATTVETCGWINGSPDRNFGTAELDNQEGSATMVWCCCFDSPVLYDKCIRRRCKLEWILPISVRLEHANGNDLSFYYNIFDSESSYAGINIVHRSVNFGVSLGSGFDFNVELRTPP
ncbi:hypothetical protein E4U12_004257 [Claviceps purpurea]|nr:hypothetical protein E4U12_004257 [Claviceps purpurea]